MFYSGGHYVIEVGGAKAGVTLTNKYAFCVIGKLRTTAKPRTTGSIKLGRGGGNNYPSPTVTQGEISGLPPPRA